MKKLVIFSLIAMMVAGAAFAQEIDIGGYFRVGADVIGGNTEATADGHSTQDRLSAGVTGFRGRLNFSAQNDEGTFGGHLRLQQNAGEAFGVKRAWVWWQPIEMIKFQVGILDDFYVDEIVNTFGGDAEETGVYNTGTNFVTDQGWSFSRTGRVKNPDYDPNHPWPFMWDGTTIVIDPDYEPEYIQGTVAGDSINTLDFNTLMNDAFGELDTVAGAALSLYPIEGLTINLAVPFGKGDGNGTLDWSWEAERVYKAFFAQAAFEINDIGRVSLGFQGEMGVKRHVTSYNVVQGMNFDMIADGSDWGTLYLGFLLGAVENLSLNFGLAFPLPETQTYDWEDTGASVSIKDTIQRPINIGLGVTFDVNDALGIGARIGVGLGGSYKTDISLDGAAKAGYEAFFPTDQDKKENPLSREYKGNTLFGIQILPSYDLGIFKAFLNAGLTITAYADNENKDLSIAPKRADQVGFWVNPYIEKTMGPGSFFCGVDLFTNGQEVDEVETLLASAKAGKMDYKYKDAVLQWRIPVGMKFSF